MIEYPSIIMRIAIGKAIGSVIGLAGFIALPFLVPEISWQLRWGILFWYTTVGAIVGVFGICSRHPVLMVPLPRWVRAPLIDSTAGGGTTVELYLPYQSTIAAAATYNYPATWSSAPSVNPSSVRL